MVRGWSLIGTLTSSGSTKNACGVGLLLCSSGEKTDV